MAQQKYLIGNAKNVKDILTVENIPAPQLIISSPPYFDLLDYGNKKQIGYGQKNYEDYLDVLCKVFQDCYELSASDATFWLVIDTFKKNQEVKLLPFDIVNKLKETFNKTWLLRDILIWDKGKSLPWNSKGNFKNEHEYIMFFTKGDKFKFQIDRVREIVDLKKWWKTYPERYNPNGKAPSNIWNFTTPIRGWGDSKQNHFCPFPFPLIEKIISIGTDEQDWILDPFAGSGSVLAISKQMNRNSVGLDINKQYQRLFEKEVVIGAERYWKKRVAEIEAAKGFLKNFKQTNQKLRKLKVASNICEHLNKINKHSFVYYSKDRAENGLEIIIVQNGKIPKQNLNNKELQDLIKQSKVNPFITIQKDSDVIKELNGSKVYKYKLDKFFSYSSLCRMEKVLDDAASQEYMYSNIALKISS